MHQPISLSSVSACCITVGFAKYNYRNPSEKLAISATCSYTWTNLLDISYYFYMLVYVFLVGLHYKKETIWQMVRLFSDCLSPTKEVKSIYVLLGLRLPTSSL